MKLKALAMNTAVLAASAGVAIGLCEAGARIALHPADYLSVEMVYDPILGAVLAANTGAGGFDAWGFRNPEVPKNVDIVAIGDSHTYGNTATMGDSWPYVLQKDTGRSIYNMGLGGYGPNQYFHSFETHALALKPKMIICGLYMGDDFENAYLITYGLEHWASLRALPPEQVNFDIWEQPPAPSWHKGIRVWLSRHSVFYQVLFHGPLLGALQGGIQIKNAHDMYPAATSLILPQDNIEEAFLPEQILRRLNQDSAGVREGMRITFHLLQKMKEMSTQNGIDFKVVVIPTKETVFADYLEHNAKLPLSDVIDKLIANERIARDKTFVALAEAKIDYIDALPALKAQVRKQLYAHTATDMHPGRNGYRVIAEAIEAHLKAAGSNTGSNNAQLTQ